MLTLSECLSSARTAKGPSLPSPCSRPCGPILRTLPDTLSRTRTSKHAHQRLQLETPLTVLPQILHLHPLSAAQHNITIFSRTVLLLSCPCVPSLARQTSYSLDTSRSRFLVASDNIFYGLLQSNVQCGSCNHVTSAFDPMLDVSLDLGRQLGIQGENTLAQCLRRSVQLFPSPGSGVCDLTEPFNASYTSPERGQQYTCARCGVSSPVSPSSSFFSATRYADATSYRLRPSSSLSAKSRQSSRSNSR